jgi:hypothetical protein
VYGGLVFVPLTRDYLKSWGDEWWTLAPHPLMALHESGIRSKDRTEVVLISKILSDRTNQGYSDLANAVVARVDGNVVRHLRDLITYLENPAGKARARFARIELDDGREVVLDRALAREQHAAILKKYRVPADRSDDLKLVPNTRKRGD